MRWYTGGLRKYAVFKGRARRREYWMYALCNGTISAVLVVVGIRTGTQLPYLGYLAVVVLPSLGMTVRRLHDIGHSAWSLLIALIPFFGSIAMLVFTCADSDTGPNKYGPVPKRQAAHL